MRLMSAFPHVQSLTMRSPAPLRDIGALLRKFPALQALAISGWGLDVLSSELVQKLQISTNITSLHLTFDYFDATALHGFCTFFPRLVELHVEIPLRIREEAYADDVNLATAFFKSFADAALPPTLCHISLFWDSSTTTTTAHRAQSTCMPGSPLFDFLLRWRTSRDGTVHEMTKYGFEDSLPSVRRGIHVDKGLSELELEPEIISGLHALSGLILHSSVYCQPWNIPFDPGGRNEHLADNAGIRSFSDGHVPRQSSLPEGGSNKLREGGTRSQFSISTPVSLRCIQPTTFKRSQGGVKTDEGEPATVWYRLTPTGKGGGQFGHRGRRRLEGWRSGVHFGAWRGLGRSQFNKLAEKSGKRYDQCEADPSMEDSREQNDVWAKEHFEGTGLSWIFLFLPFNRCGYDMFGHADQKACPVLSRFNEG
ncbi:hypothetical protein B0H17DRAFT_1146382 [Mycena rosella]|uniref:Uncharacterized protein n=1 Tax=Mycena rosella TaxID=1033263 RepID=A0AAD7G1F3_MYCRO|nr:hypothetical protein B0H17DRAFT_1146382 [Mycena rosella]